MNLRQAAEEVIEAWCWDASEPRNKALRERMEALRQALAQEQEPVGWMQPTTSGTYISETKDEWHTVPVYTAPPKQWVGLTDDEIGEMDGAELKYIGTGEYVIDGEYEFAKAIEAKLKEKNGG